MAIAGGQAPGALHHIIARGIERRKIFKDDTDRINFLNQLGKVLSETSTTGGWLILSGGARHSGGQKFILKVTNASSVTPILQIRF